MKSSLYIFYEKNEIKIFKPFKEKEIKHTRKQYGKTITKKCNR